MHPRLFAFLILATFGPVLAAEQWTGNTYIGIKSAVLQYSCRSERLYVTGLVERAMGWHSPEELRPLTGYVCDDWGPTRSPRSDRAKLAVWLKKHNAPRSLIREIMRAVDLEASMQPNKER